MSHYKIFSWWTAGIFGLGAFIVGGLAPGLVPQEWVGPAVVGGLLLMALAIVFAIPNLLSLWKAPRHIRMGTFLFGVSAVMFVAAIVTAIAAYGFMYPKEAVTTSAELQETAAKSEAGARGAVPAPEAKRHYSNRDRDNLADAFDWLRKKLSTDADSLQLEGQRIWQTWERIRSLPTPEKPISVEDTEAKLASLKERASYLSDQIFKGLIKNNPSYEALLKQIIDYRVPDPFIELVHRIDQLQGPLISARQIYENAPAQWADAALLVAQMLVPFERTTAQLNGWIADTQRRIDEAENEVLAARR